ncbi:hypothetical protein ACRAWF_16985 [Streptomyces sp. L7]
MAGQRAKTALAQLLGPYRAAYGCFPALSVLRELLEGEPSALAALRAALAGDEHAVMRREVEAGVRQSGSQRSASSSRTDWPCWTGRCSPSSSAGGDTAVRARSSAARRRPSPPAGPHRRRPTGTRRPPG